MTLENLTMDDLMAECPDCKGTGWTGHGPGDTAPNGEFLHFRPKTFCPGCRQTGKVPTPGGAAILAFLKVMHPWRS